MFTTLKQKYYKLGDQKALERAKSLIENNPELKAQYTKLCEEVELEIGEYKKYATAEQLKDIETALIFLDKAKVKKAIKNLKESISISFFSMDKEAKISKTEPKKGSNVLDTELTKKKAPVGQKAFVIKSKKPIEIEKAKEAFKDFKCNVCGNKELAYFEAIDAFVCKNCFPQSDVVIQVINYTQPLITEYVYELYLLY
ncbi:hypothetical protein Calkr_0664 [Caldicellulosiruptor acetigenus I77R1B]|uniref:Uncharacterized protein n=1 Tax=Caldicellulosiruptor acetigenus (strain ATCC 700853 / DSM 12137 / I77R1B) TaxID=632335 RepID=E4SAC6_CALA7|nr:hypothetical protein [Caldicellulosiruptor acetigenus]ADQ40203.1 hypothetical protein Calkr_0664 [Caldicellulosiruptor acetigenus I77R1B]